MQNVAFNIAVNQHQTTLASYFSQSGATGEILHYFKNVYVVVEMVFSFSFLGGGDGSGSWRKGGPFARISFTVLTTVHRIKMKRGEF